MKIDVHAHFIPRDCFNVVDASGQRVGPILTTDKSGQEWMSIDGLTFGPPIVNLFHDPDLRVKDMDRIGLDMQAISVPPLNYFYYLDADLGLSISKKQNDRIAELVTAYPDRFVGMATVPMQDAGKAISELERAITQLRLKAVEINTNINGKNLDEPEFSPFFEKVQSLGVPIFLHPHYVIGPERLSRHYLINLIGNPVDTTIAVASLVFGGILERFPKLKLICAHAGGTTPFIKGRWEHAYHHLVAAKLDVTKPPSEYLKTIYFDTITHYKPALLYMVADHGVDRIVMGSDYPADMGDPDPVSTVRKLGLPDREQDKIMWRNAASLLKL